MPIRIFKKKPHRPAPVVEDKLAEGALAPAEKPRRVGPPVPDGVLSIPCPFCKKMYIQPCSEEEHGECQNWRFLQGEENPSIMHGKPIRRSSEN